MFATRSIGLLAACALLVTSAVHAADEPDAVSGKIVFEQLCGICHAVSADGSGPTMGPNLFGLIGRKAASEPNYAMYSAALKAYGVTWTIKSLDDFLSNPMTRVPGTTMPLMITDDKDRASVILYLASLE
jgi:cytochrome c2